MNEIEKWAYAQGSVNALNDLGLTKEAWGSAVAKLLPMLGKLFTSGGSKLLKPGITAIRAGAKPSAGARFLGWTGRNMRGFGHTLGNAGRTVGEVGLPTAFGRGALEFGKGMVGKGGVGLGGTLGRGTMNAAIGSMFLPSGSSGMAASQMAPMNTNPYAMYGYPR